MKTLVRKTHCKRGHERTPENLYAHGTCKICQDARSKAHQQKPENKARLKSCDLKRRYGLTLKEREEILLWQGFKCANPACCVLNTDTKKGLHTDHCHDTGKFRGLLCQGCNLSLGQLKNDPSTIRGLADYMEKHL